MLKLLKKIWQKITIVYNQIYEKLIVYFYTTDIRRDLLKKEIVDFYKSIIAVNSVNIQQKMFEETRWFITQLIGKYIKFELEQLDSLCEQYNSISRGVYILSFIGLLLIISTVVLWVLIY